MNRWLSLAAAGALAMAPYPPALGAENTVPVGSTLESLLVVARQSNPDLQAMRYDAQAAGQRVVPAGALSDPLLNMELRDVTNQASGAGTSLSPANVGSTRYQLRQAFLPWGQRDAKQGAAHAAADEATFRANAAWTDLAMRVKTAYARWQQLHAALVQMRELLVLNNRIEAVAQARYAGGLAPQQDPIRAQVERTAMVTDILLTEAELVTTRARINGLLARPPESHLATPIADAGMPLAARLDLQTLRGRVLAHNPLIAADEARLRAAERKKDAVWSNRYPGFTFGVAPVQSGSRISEWELMFEINIPLQQGARRAEEREALSMIAAAQSRKESTANDLVAQLGEQLAGLQAALQVESLTQKTLLPQTAMTLQAALSGYESGKVDFATVMDAQRQVRQAQLNLIRTRADARVRLAEIERLLGDEP